MLCKEFETMTPKERTEYIGQLVHSCMNDSQLFAKGQTIIKAASLRGLLEGVVINPSNVEETNNQP